jgi:hypothetical protein
VTLPLGLLLRYREFMGKSIHDIAKRGRPKTTGPGTGVLVKMHDPQLDAIDAWIKKHQEPGLSRPEAIRRLVELGLTVKAKARPASRPGRTLRAQELAWKTVEKLVDPAAPPEERAERQRRLTKGPEEFREVRVDRPKI